MGYKRSRVRIAAPRPLIRIYGPPRAAFFFSRPTLSANGLQTELSGGPEQGCKLAGGLLLKAPQKVSVGLDRDRDFGAAPSQNQEGTMPGEIAFRCPRCDFVGMTTGQQACAKCGALPGAVV